MSDDRDLKIAVLREALERSMEHVERLELENKLLRSYAITDHEIVAALEKIESFYRAEQARLTSENQRLTHANSVLHTHHSRPLDYEDLGETQQDSP